MLNEVGFVDCELVADTGFNSSPITKGALFRARKPKDVQRRRDMSSNPMERYDEFFSMVYRPGALDVKVKHLVALGASLGAGCGP